ncbi:TRAP transporter small permease [Desulfogranum japonicum]|uniref:TRAP transporter small permease n=1 Tax=Desulfogranum japonicum TaxID=231447 RepID=UPI0004268C3C|nr:TRAP transporter small permease [Desulfogranum japonicum]
MKKSLVIDRIFIRLGHFVSVLFLVVVCISFFEVIMRYVFNSPTIWVHETTSFLVSLAMLFGGISVYASEKHIAMTFIADSFPVIIRWYTTLFVEICTLVFAIMMTYGAFLSAKDAFISPFGKFRMQTSGSALDMPFPALNKGFFFLTCVMLVFLVILHLLRHVMSYGEAKKEHIAAKKGE